MFKHPLNAEQLLQTIQLKLFIFSSAGVDKAISGPATQVMAPYMTIFGSADFNAY